MTPHPSNSSTSIRPYSWVYYFCVWGYLLVAVLGSWLQAHLIQGDGNAGWPQPDFAPLLVALILFGTHVKIARLYASTLYRFENLRIASLANLQKDFLVAASRPALFVLFFFCAIWSGFDLITSHFLAGHAAFGLILAFFVGSYFVPKLLNRLKGVVSGWKKQNGLKDEILSAIVLPTANSSKQQFAPAPWLLVVRCLSVIVQPSTSRGSFIGGPAAPQTDNNDQKRRPYRNSSNPKRRGTVPPHHDARYYRPGSEHELTESYSWAFHLTAWIAPAAIGIYWSFLALQIGSETTRAVVLFFYLACAVAALAAPVLKVTERYELSLQCYELNSSTSRSKFRRQVLFALLTVVPYMGLALLGKLFLLSVLNVAASSRGDPVVFWVLVWFLIGVVSAIANFYFAWAFTPLEISFPDFDDRPKDVSDHVRRLVKIFQDK